MHFCSEISKKKYYDKFMSIKSSHPGRRGFGSHFRDGNTITKQYSLSLLLSACSPRTLRTEGEQTGASLNYSWEGFQQSLASPGVVLEASPGRQHYTRSDCHLQGSPGTGPARTLRKHTGTEVVTKTKGSCGRVVVATNSTKPSPRSLPPSPR